MPGGTGGLRIVGLTGLPLVGSVGFLSINLRDQRGADIRKPAEAFKGPLRDAGILVDQQRLPRRNLLAAEALQAIVEAAVRRGRPRAALPRTTRFMVMSLGLSARGSTSPGSHRDRPDPSYRPTRNTPLGPPSHELV